MGASLFVLKCCLLLACEQVCVCLFQERRRDMERVGLYFYLSNKWP